MYWISLNDDTSINFYVKHQTLLIWQNWKQEPVIIKRNKNNETHRYFITGKCEITTSKKI